VGVDTAKRLNEVCPNVVGIKEAGGSSDRITQFRQAFGNNFDILSGDDGMTVPFMALGAQGVISVASNVIPKAMSQLVQAMLKSDLKKALQIHEKYAPLFKALFLESNPTPVKAALAMMGKIEPEYRLPLVRVSPKTKKIIKETLISCGLLN
jgi:4-hydroxy-tetrahydrodipicolinate synthase